MKILVITNSFGTNGAAAMLRQIAGFWVEGLSWDVDAISTANVSNSDKELVKKSGIRLMGNTVDLRPYDVVLINTLVDLNWIEKIPTKVRVVIWAHEGESMLFGVNWSAREWYEKLSRARLLIFQTPWQTQSVYKSYLWKIPSEKIKIIPNGILPIDFQELPSQDKNPAFKVISVGSVYPRKRPMDLARAIVNLNKKLKISCSFVGDNSNFSMLGEEALDISTNNSEVLEWSGELHGEVLYRKLVEADILCHPSGDESFPLAPLEAALLGLPVILANLECYAHVGWVTEENCLMFPVGDVSALQDRIERLTKDPALFQRLKSNGKILAESMSWKSFCTQMTDAMEQACTN
ncbi:MAG: glycosyltransferase family 4 protein [Pseudomonadota bacterium]